MHSRGLKSFFHMSRILKNKTAYPWLVLAATTIVTFLCMGMAMIGFSLYFPYIKDAYGFTDTQIGTLISIRNLFSFLAKALTVLLIGRTSAKKVAIFTSLLATAALLCCWVSKGFWGYALGLLLAGASNGFGNMIIVAVLLRRWFVDKLPIAIGIASAGSGISSVVCPVMITAWTQKFGLTGSFGAYFLTALILSLLVIVLVEDSPEKIGAVPYGYEKIQESRDTVKTSRDSCLNKTGQIMLYAASVLLGMYCVTASSILGLHYSSIGLTNEQMTLNTSVFGFSLLAGKLGQGFLANYIGGKKTSVIAFILVVAGCLVNTIVEHPFVLLLAAVGSGFGTALGSMGSSIWAGDFVSDGEYEVVVGRCQTIQSLGGLVFSAVPGILAESFGNYKIAWAFYLVIAAIMSVLIMVLYMSSKNTNQGNRFFSPT